MSTAPNRTLEERTSPQSPRSKPRQEERVRELMRHIRLCVSEGGRTSREPGRRRNWLAVPCAELFLSAVARVDAPMTAAARTSERNSSGTPYWLMSVVLRRIRSQPALQLSGPRKAAALVKDPAVPSSNDTKSATSNESLFSSSGGSPSWGPTSITVNNIRTTTAPIYTAIWNTPVYEASRRKKSPAMPRNEIPRAAAP